MATRTLRDSLLQRHLPNAAGGGVRIRGTEITHDRDAVFDAPAQDRPDHRLHAAVHTRRRVSPALELCQCQGSFGQHLEDQHARTTAGDERVHDRSRGVRAVASESRRTADGQDVLSHCFSSAYQRRTSLASASQQPSGTPVEGYAPSQAYCIMA